MKLLTAFAFFIISTSLFAESPYSFKCVTSSDGKCSITSSNSHIMKLMSNGEYGGSEGEYNMYYSPEDDGSYLYVYKGNTQLAQSEGSYLAVPTSNGYAGIIIVEGLDEIPDFIKPKL